MVSTSFCITLDVPITVEIAIAGCVTFLAVFISLPDPRLPIPQLVAADSASYLRWQDREANKRFFNGEIQAFSKEAADLLLEIGLIKTKPDLNAIVDTQFIK